MKCQISNGGDAGVHTAKKVKIGRFRSANYFGRLSDIKAILRVGSRCRDKHNRGSREVRGEDNESRRI